MTEPDSPQDFEVDTSESIWTELERTLDRFAAAWDGAETPPPLAEFVPGAPAELRRLALSELIKLDLEYRWSGAGDRKTLDSYLEDFPELRRSDLPADLLYEEAHLRRRAGEITSAADYTRRFPRQAEALGHLLADTATENGSACAPRTPADLDAGDTVDDFELLAELGRGSFARVFLARQRSMLRLVALKISRTSSEEPRTLAQLNHPDIVRVHDQRILPERGLHLLYMEYVPGGTLRDVIDRVSRSSPNELSGATLVGLVDESLDLASVSREIDTRTRTRLQSSSWPSAVAWVGARLARALAYAHRRGVRHHDIKPANVLLTAECSPKLADFNVSDTRDRPEPGEGGSVGGSIAYMSPEHLDAFRRGGSNGRPDLDERTDIYSLGVLLWELLHGKRPFDDPARIDAAGLEELSRSRRRGAPEPSDRAAHDDELRAIETILRRCMSPEPDARYQSAAELAAELELASEPRVAKLLRSPTAGWIAAARRLPLMTVLALALVPHALAGVFNFVYNRREIVESIADGERVLFAAQLWINSTAFPLGIAVGVWWVLPIARALRRRRRGESLASEATAASGTRALQLGHRIALLGLGEWLVAGIAYPLVFRLSSGPLPTSVHLHFLASLALCGLIAVAYPFFGVTTVAVRAWCPVLLDRTAMPERAVAAAAAARRRSWIYLGLSAAVPMLATALLVFLGSGDRLALGVLTVAALIGFIVVLLFFRALQNDLAALHRVAEILNRSAA